MEKEWCVTLTASKDKQYVLPIKWLVNWVPDNTSYDGMNAFIKKANRAEINKAIKCAKTEGVGHYL